MAVDSLPTAIRTDPTCGHCGETLWAEGGDYTCRACRIWWAADSLDEPAMFVYPEEDVCGEGEGCILPEGHTSEHMYPLAIGTVDGA